MPNDGSLTGVGPKRVSFNLRGRPKSMGNFSPTFDELASLPNVDIPVKARNLLLSKSTIQQLPPPPPTAMPRFLKRKPSLFVDTKAANQEPERSNSDEDDVFAAIFNANSRGYERQAAEPTRAIQQSLSNSVISQRAVPPVQPSPPLAEELEPQSSPRPLFGSSSEEGSDEEELLQTEYEKFREIGRSKGWSEEEIDDLFDYVIENGFPELGSDHVFGFNPEEDGSDLDEREIPEFTSDDPIVKKIEQLHLQATFGEEIYSTRQLIVEENKVPTREAGGQTPFQTACNSFYLHSNDDISSHGTVKPTDSRFSSPSSSSGQKEMPLSGALPESYGGPDIPTASRVLLLTSTNNGHRTPIEGSAEVKDLVGQDSQPMTLGVTTLEAPQSDSCNPEVREQKFSNDVDDVKSIPQHEAWLSPTTAVRSKLNDPDASFAYDDVPLLLPLRYNKNFPAACEFVHTSRATSRYGGRMQPSKPPCDSNLSSFNSKARPITMSGEGEEEDDLSPGIENAAVSQSGREEQLSKIAIPLSDPSNKFDAAATSSSGNGIEEPDAAVENGVEGRLATGSYRISSKDSTQTGDDLTHSNDVLAKITPGATVNKGSEFSPHPESSPVHTTLTSLTTQAQSTTTNLNLTTNNMPNFLGRRVSGPGSPPGSPTGRKANGSSFSALKRMLSRENLNTSQSQSQSNSIAGMMNSPPFDFTSPMMTGLGANSINAVLNSPFQIPTAVGTTGPGVQAQSSTVNASARAAMLATFQQTLPNMSKVDEDDLAFSVRKVS